MNDSVQQFLTVSEIDPKLIAKLQFVVVDDVDFNLRLMESMLFVIGAKIVIGFTKPEEALNHVIKYRPDVLIVDNMMPNISGTDMTRILRSKSDPFFKRLPIIMATAYANRGHLENAQDAGISSMIGKPFSVNEILSKVRVGLKNSVNDALNEQRA